MVAEQAAKMHKIDHGSGSHPKNKDANPDHMHGHPPANHGHQPAKKAKLAYDDEFLNEYDIYDDYGYDQNSQYGQYGRYGYVGARDYDSYQEGLQGQNVGLFGNDINNDYGLMLFLPALLIGLCLLGIICCICAIIGGIMGYNMYNATNRTLSIGRYKKVARVAEIDDDSHDDQGGLIKIQVLFFFISFSTVYFVYSLNSNSNPCFIIIFNIFRKYKFMNWQRKDIVMDRSNVDFFC